jgi:hypothetical protein
VQSIRRSSAAGSCAYVYGGGGAAQADGWLAKGVGRITRAFNCDTPTSVSESAAMSGRADMDAIAAELSAWGRLIEGVRLKRG